MLKKLMAAGIVAMAPMMAPLSASAATCDANFGDPNNLDADFGVLGDTADCGTLDISQGTISVVGSFGGAFDDADGSATLTFGVIGAPDATGSVDVNIIGVALGDVTGTFGGAAINFELQDGDLTATLNAALPAQLTIVFNNASGGDNYNLNLTPVPVPAAGLLLLGGLGGLAALRRKKKAA